MLGDVCLYSRINRDNVRLVEAPFRRCGALFVFERFAIEVGHLLWRWGIFDAVGRTGVEQTASEFMGMDNWRTWEWSDMKRYG